MAKNIDFMGAVFPDVPSVKLPQQGGGLVAFDDTTDATATADKILQGYTAYAGGQKLVGTASGGGGASNVVVGSFKATEDGVLTVPLSYVGAGYPLSLIVFVKDGYHADNTDFRSLVRSGAVAIWGFTKAYPKQTPTYLHDSETQNQADIFYVRKNSTSSATNYTQSSARGTNVFTTDAVYAIWNHILKMPSATSMSLYFSSSSGTVSFQPNIEYAYHIVYSS